MDGGNRTPNTKWVVRIYFERSFVDHQLRWYWLSDWQPARVSRERCNEPPNSGVTLRHLHLTRVTFSSYECTVSALKLYNIQCYYINILWRVVKSKRVRPLAQGSIHDVRCLSFNVTRVGELFDIHWPDCLMICLGPSDTSLFLHIFADKRW